MIFVFSDFEFDDDRYELRRGGEVVPTEPNALRTLRTLLHRAGQVVTKDELVADAWDGRTVSDNVLTVAVARLRRALNTGTCKHVLTVYGRGYRFVGPYRTYVPAEGTFGMRTTGVSLTPLVGREHAMSRLKQCVAEATGGHGRVCVLTGEAGIGKTRLMESLHVSLRQASVPAAWTFGRAADDAEPLSPWLRLIRKVAAASVRRPSVVLRHLQTLEELGRTHAVSVPARTPSEDRPSASRHRLYELITQAFAAAAEETPWVVMLDDLHRMDGASLEALVHLIDEVAHMRLLIVAALRTGIGRSAAAIEPMLSYVAGHRNTERVALERLQEGDVSSYVSRICCDHEGGLAKAVYLKSEGNAFFMTELVRNLAANESPGHGLQPLPSVAFDLLRQRVSLLSFETRCVLMVASVIGRSFELSLLQVVLERSATEIMSCIDEARAAHLLVLQVGARTAFAFDLGLVRDMLYDDLALPQRRLWHDRIATALMGRIKLRQSIAPEVVATHLHAALPMSNPRTTVRYCLAAAQTTGRNSNYQEAVRYLTAGKQALGLISGSQLRLRTFVLLMLAYHSAGTLPGQNAAEELLRLVRGDDRPDMLVRTASLLMYMPGTSSHPYAREVLQSALGILRPEEQALRAIALASLASVAPNCFHRERAAQLLSEARICAARSGSSTARVAALGHSVYLTCEPTSAEELEAVLASFVRRGAALPARGMAQALQLYRALRAQMHGLRQEATLALESRAWEACERSAVGDWHLSRGRALIEFNRGRADGVGAALMRLHEIAKQQELLGCAAFCAFDRLIVIPAIIGVTTELDDDLRDALLYCSSDPPALWALKVSVLASAGELDGARLLLRSVAPADLAELPHDAQYVGTLGHLAHAACTVGSREHAAALHRLLVPLSTKFTAHLTFVPQAVPLLLARLSSLLGEHARAVREAAEALVMSEKAGLPAARIEAACQLAALSHAQLAPLARPGALKMVRESHLVANTAGYHGLAEKIKRLIESHLLDGGIDLHRHAH